MGLGWCNTNKGNIFSSWNLFRNQSRSKFRLLFVGIVVVQLLCKYDNRPLGDMIINMMSNIISKIHKRR
jgi:hypothetical protein